MTTIKLVDLARLLCAELHGNGDIIIKGIASINNAVVGDITFIVNNKYREQLKKCQASAVVMTRDNLPYATTNVLVVKDPYLTYARIAQIFDTTPNQAQNISSNAIINPSVTLGNKISIGANTVIESNAIIEDNVIIGAGCFIGKNSIIGAGSRILANVTIYHEVLVGKRCLIQSGAVIGGDGFGYVNDQGGWIKIPQLGRVIIGDKVEIGACTTIDRGSLDDTVIDNGVIIDNQCHIAHNVTVGSNTAIAGGVIMAGSIKIGSNCMIGGASVINGHIEICNDVIITGMSMVIRTIKKPGIYSSGIPLQPNKIWRKTAILVMNIKDMNKRLKIIEHIVNQHKK